MDNNKNFIRLSKAARELNTAISEIVDFLDDKGFDIDSNPNNKLTQEQFELIKNEINLNRKNKAVGKINLDKVKRDAEERIANNNKKSRESKKEYKAKLPNKSWRVGKVKFFDNEKGFGFVKSWDDEEEYFIHISKVETEPINDNDYVVFQLRPSRKKAGTLEAIKLFLISLFYEDPEYLIKQYKRFDNKYFRKDIIKALPLEATISLIEYELLMIESIDNNKDYAEFQNVITLFNTFERNKRHEIERVFSQWAYKNANNIYKILLWLEGIIKIQPDYKTIDSLISFIPENKKFEILRKLDISSKKNFIKKMISEKEPETFLDSLIDYFKKINAINENSDTKQKKFYQEKHWKKKEDYELYLSIINYLKEILKERQKLTLFLNGYLNSVSSDYVISHCYDLKRQDIEEILQKSLLSSDKLSILINKLFEKQINDFLDYLNDQGENTITHKSMNRWRKVYKEEAEPFYWIFEIVQDYLSADEVTKIERKFLESVPNWFYYHFWNKKYISIISKKYISEIFLKKEDFQNDIEKWLDDDRISKEEIIDIINTNIKALHKISNRSQFYVLYRHIKVLVDHGSNIKYTENQINEYNFWFFKLINWIEGISKDFNFEEFKTKLIYLNPEDQVKFIKKLFYLAHIGEFELTIDKLEQLTRIDFDVFILNDKYNSEILLDITVEVIIKVLKSYSQTSKFHIAGKEMSAVLERNMLNKKKKIQLSGFFEECRGRYKPEIEIRGRVKEINNSWEISFRYDSQLVNEVKKLPGRKYNPQKRRWYVPSVNEKEVINFAQNNDFLIIKNNSTGDNEHLAKFKRNHVPEGICFCEGRLSKKRDYIFNQAFWWCNNEPCFSKCETIHSPEEWEKYTLLDLLIILGFETENGIKIDGFTERPRYYQFISMINRYNKLLEKMYCNECGELLFPSKDSNFAFYRVTIFHCENTECSKYHEEIYLHHCLNGKCAEIIDSRESEQCPNGLYICSNENCGCCCSTNMLARVKKNREITGEYISEKLRNMVDNKLGHLERGEHFCYKCGTSMEETAEDIFICPNCKIKYDVTENKFKRPYKNENNSSSNSQSVVNDGDDLPF